MITKNNHPRFGVTSNETLSESQLECTLDTQHSCVTQDTRTATSQPLQPPFSQKHIVTAQKTVVLTLTKKIEDLCQCT